MRFATVILRIDLEGSILGKYVKVELKGTGLGLCGITRCVTACVGALTAGSTDIMLRSVFRKDTRTDFFM